MPPHDVGPAATASMTRPRLLDPDARFAHLPRPDYDPDATGIRTGAAVTLSLFGGVLVAVSPFGAWLRVIRVAAEGGRRQLIHELLGVDLGLGVWVALFGVAALVAGRAWHRGGRLWRRVAHAVVLAAAAVTGIALLLLQARIGDATTEAIEQAGFFNLTVGVGWGAWAAITGAVALVLASVCAALTYDGRSR